MNVSVQVLKSIVKDAIKSGISAYRTLRELREHGIKIRTKTFYDIWEEEKNTLAYEGLFEKLDRFKKIPDRLHIRTVDKIPTRFKYGVDLFDVYTNRWHTVWVYDDVRLSPEEAIEEAIFQAESKYRMKVLEAKLRFAVKRKK